VQLDILLLTLAALPVTVVDRAEYRRQIAVHSEQLTVSA